MRGLQIILSPFRDKLNKFNNTRTQMLDYIHHYVYFAVNENAHNS